RRVSSARAHQPRGGGDRGARDREPVGRGPLERRPGPPAVRALGRHAQACRDCPRAVGRAGDAAVRRAHGWARSDDLEAGGRHVSGLAGGGVRHGPGGTPRHRAGPDGGGPRGRPDRGPVRGPRPRRARSFGGRPGGPGVPRGSGEMSDRRENAEKLRVGVFVILAILTFLGLIYALGARARLFESRYTVHAEFTEVGGLLEGATVRLAG